MIVGIYGGLAGLAVAMGPILGGAVTQGIDWHWIFWLKVPIGAIALPLAMRLLPDSPPSLPVGGGNEESACTFPGRVEGVRGGSPRVSGSARSLGGLPGPGVDGGWAKRRCAGPRSVRSVVIRP